MALCPHCRSSWCDGLYCVEARVFQTDTCQEHHLNVWPSVFKDALRQYYRHWPQRINGEVVSGIHVPKDAEMSFFVDRPYHKTIDGNVRQVIADHHLLLTWSTQADGKPRPSWIELLRGHPMWGKSTISLFGVEDTGDVGFQGVMLKQWLTIGHERGRRDELLSAFRRGDGDVIAEALFRAWNTLMEVT